MKSRLAPFALLLALACASPDKAEVAPQPTSRPAGWPVQMASRYDVVAFREKEAPVPGSRAHQLIHDDSLLYFSSEENKTRFIESPERYWPEFDGWCACGMAEGKRLWPSGTAFTVREGKLYLFANEAMKEKWAANPGEFIAKGESNFPEMK